MRRLLVALAIATIVLTPGCLDRDFDELLGGSDDRQVQQIHSFTQSFSYSAIFDPENPPGGEEDAFQTEQSTFEVPAESEDLIVHYVVEFRSSDDASPPQEVQEVRLGLDGPGAEEDASTTITSSQDGQWSFPVPTGGTWTFTMETRGEGVVTMVAYASVPVDT